MLKRKSIDINPYKKADSGTINAFLIDFETTSIWEGGEERPGLDLYYFTDDGEPIKCFLPHDPYFYIDCEDVYKESEKKFNILQRRIRDVDDGNHIRDIELVTVRDSLHPDHKFLKESKLVKITLDSPRSVKSRNVAVRDDVLRVDGIVGTWREADIHFDMRVSIDKQELVKVGRHYRVIINMGIVIKITETPVAEFPDLPCCAFDLETCKDPMKTPNPDHNPIGTIGAQFDYDGGVIICNADVIRNAPGTFIMGTTEEDGKKVLHWEDASKNGDGFRNDHDNCMLIEPIIMPDEETALLKFMDMLVEKGTLAIAGYNSDNFDWPYVAKRLEKYDRKMEDFGFRYNKFQDAYYIPGIICLDAYLYVAQHSRLPEGERSLKSATKKIFHFDPIEWDDPEMLGNAMTHGHDGYDPVTVVYYNGSDIYCTMLFLKDIMIPYFMSLAMDKPMNLFSLSRRGFSILCEGGLLQRAHKFNIVSPNRGSGKSLEESDDSILEKGSRVEINNRVYYVISQSYLGAKVELNQPGLYRSDLASNIHIDPEKINSIIDTLDDAVDMELEWVNEEGGSIINKDEVMQEVKNTILKIVDEAQLIDGEWVYDGPLEIIHCDVASLYPSIIITYKIQPQAVVSEEECNSCPYQEEDPKCWCEMDWTRVLKVINSNEGNVKVAKQIISGKLPDDTMRKLRNKYRIVDDDDFTDILEKVVKKDNKGKAKREIEIPLKSRICQKSHGFFWQEVQDVRDDRYMYKYKAGDYFDLKEKEEKKLHKYMEIVANRYEKEGLRVRDEDGKLDMITLLEYMDDNEFSKREDIFNKAQEYHTLATFNNFIQEGKKAALNSYYGYLFTTGVRWWSIVSAGTITVKGRSVLLSAIDHTSCLMQLLEADTDGYYTLIPKIFPVIAKFDIRDKNGNRVREKRCNVNVLSAILNYHSAQNFTNVNSYEEIDGRWENAPRCYLKWDTDGPYDTMFVQAKKKYAIWKGDKLVVLKGLETKRNNALMLERELINGIFDRYKSSKISSLDEAYKSAEKYFRRMVNDLRSGKTPIELLVKNTNMSRLAIKRLDNAKNGIRIMNKYGVNDFAYSFTDMELMKVALKYQLGDISRYKAKAIVNSMYHNNMNTNMDFELDTDDGSMFETQLENIPAFKMDVDDLQVVIDAYEGKKGINKGAQFMTAFRVHDMGTEIDEYSSVAFIKSIYPQTEIYTMNKSGKLTAKEVTGGVSECMVPVSILNMGVDTINRFIKRWTGNHPDILTPEDIDTIIDFDYYISYIKNLADRLIIVPAATQGIKINMEDVFDESKIKNRSMDEFLGKGSGRRDIPKFDNETKSDSKPKRNQKGKSNVSIKDFLS